MSLALETNADGKITGVPYVVPGGRFNELYCWDSYFIVLGLLQDGRTDLARGMADNLLYEVRYYGKIPNANRTYYLTRSQPPFLTSIIRAVYESGAVDKTWLASALKTAMTEYQNVWLGNDRLVKIGPYELSRYYDTGNGPCPEVEPGHYDEQMQPWLAQVKPENPDLPLTPYRFLNEYLYCGKYADLKADGLTLDEFFKHDRAVRESGHDTTHRFDDRTADFVSVDLNSLLYKYETDFADLIENEFGGNLPGVSGELRRREILAAARRRTQGGDAGVDVGRTARLFFRLRFCQSEALDLHQRHRPVAALGKNARHEQSGGNEARQTGRRLRLRKTGAVRRPFRDGKGIRRIRAPSRCAAMGLSLRLGAAPDARVARLQKLRPRCRRRAARVSLALLPSPKTRTTTTA